jgi:hypothetical protein
VSYRQNPSHSRGVGHPNAAAAEHPALGRDSASREQLPAHGPCLVGEVAPCRNGTHTRQYVRCERHRVLKAVAQLTQCVLPPASDTAGFHESARMPVPCRDGAHIHQHVGCRWRRRRRPRAVAYLAIVVVAPASDTARRLHGVGRWGGRDRTWKRSALRNTSKSRRVPVARPRSSELLRKRAGRSPERRRYVEVNARPERASGAWRPQLQVPVVHRWRWERRQRGWSGQERGRRRQTASSDRAQDETRQSDAARTSSAMRRIMILPRRPGVHERREAVGIGGLGNRSGDRRGHRCQSTDDTRPSSPPGDGAVVLA